MKKIYIGILLCFVFLCCAQQKQITSPLQEIIYNASSRGFYFQVNIRENHISVARERGPSVLETPLPTHIWEELRKMTGSLNLDRLDRLVAPSNESTTDRAAIAFIEVVTNLKTYHSVSFDHGNPPEALEALVNKIVQLAETVE